MEDYQQLLLMKNVDGGLMARKELLKEEAIYRMKQLKIKDEVITIFNSSNKLLCSNYGFITEVPPNIIKNINHWEKIYGTLAYHVIYSKLFGYEIYNALSVSNYKEDWIYERGIINDGWAMAYTVNVTKPDYSESGSIKLYNFQGILERIN